MLAKYISALLAQESAVTIPGFGRLESRYDGSRISGTELLPPTRSIQFDPYTTHDEEQRLRQFVEQQGVTNTKDWDKLLHDFIETIEEASQNGGRCTLPTLGTFFKEGQNGHWQFEAASSLASHPLAFGLPTLDLKRTTARQAATPTPTPTPTPKSEPVSATVHPNPAPEPATETEKVPQKKNNNELITWLVVIPLIFVFAFLVWLFIQSSSSPAVSQDEPIVEQAIPPTPSPEPAEDPATPPPDPSPEVETDDQQTIEEQTPPPVAETEKSTPAPITEGRQLGSPTGAYYLIVGSFTEKAEAQKMLDKLLSEGKEAYFMPHESQPNTLRVAVGTYPDEATATNARSSLTGYPSWVKKW